MRKAKNPGELTEILLECIKTQDIEGIASVYEKDAKLVIGANEFAIGIEAIKKFYAELAAQKPELGGHESQPVVINGNIALTSSVLADGRITAEVARKQPDGTWLWCLDNPAHWIRK